MRVGFNGAVGVLLTVVVSSFLWEVAFRPASLVTVLEWFGQLVQVAMVVYGLNSFYLLSWAVGLPADAAAPAPAPAPAPAEGGGGGTGSDNSAVGAGSALPRSPWRAFGVEPVARESSGLGDGGGDGDEWPMVTVQLPIFNERLVVERVLRCCARLRYPADRLEIQVLDDSTDGTREIARSAIGKLRCETDVRISHVFRTSRTNFKAGALVQGTAKARGEFLAIFDADFMPDPDFLLRTIPLFADEEVGCVQCRWGHHNADVSLLTVLQAMGHDSHFMVEQQGRWRAGLKFNFNGTAGVWRRQCVMEAGDWSGDTLAEDLDLSYRAQLHGWKMEFMRDVVVPAELPLSIASFKKQQARWAKGSMQNFIKMLRPTWDSRRLSLGTKLQATIHLFGYGFHLLMFLHVMTTVVLALLGPSRGVDLTTLLSAVASLGPTCSVAFSQIRLGRARRLFLLPLLLLLHYGLCLSNTAAVLEALGSRGGAFERTPKFGELSASSNWATDSYADALGVVDLPLGELLMIGMLATTLSSSMVYLDSAATVRLLSFLLGFMFLVFLHVREALSMTEARRALLGRNNNLQVDGGKHGSGPDRDPRDIPWRTSTTWSSSSYSAAPAEAVSTAAAAAEDETAATAAAAADWNRPGGRSRR